MTDTAADGICCDFGQGKYQIYFSESAQGGILFVEGGDFGMVEVVSFAVEQGQLIAA
jgi:hypothetical protein